MNKLLVKFIILTYIVFFIFIGIIGFILFMLKQETLANVLTTISAWSSTFVFLFLFKKINPTEKVLDYVKKQFSERIKISTLLLLICLMTFILISNIIAIGFINNLKFSELIILSPKTLLVLFFTTLISGPMGEELGWRSFFQIELQKKYQPIIAGIITGIFWGFWHSPLWFITTGLTGINLLIYCISFMVAIVSFSVIIALLYNKNRNLIIPILGHQLFNYFLGIQKTEIILLLIISAIFLFVAALILSIIHNKIFGGRKD